MGGIFCSHYKTMLSFEVHISDCNGERFWITFQIYGYDPIQFIDKQLMKRCNMTPLRETGNTENS